ncbi:uncharacterized protein FOMMEDRAFT_148688 [Fomitiporia mediterranea MF3/22]|uniref:uncharacterized protein n=1 Tax=Fomitiporia mediterranea (strain MF3/22) TaxID=694068 RepID=UPI0004407515|nr:uncharacterized protein FOMMEDRAFT_148688 [Fomitiporia mediterranea MF3/22]EJC99513.1 hypothetical protein FOMMEDRAFT_148688 [Fomitiporia mediterranea MF3/22]
MSFIVGSVYLLVDTQNQWRLFVAGSSNETSNANRTSVGTLYYPGSDLKSRQNLGVQPLSLPAPPVLILHLVNLLSSLHFKSVSSLDNHIDRIVSGGDTGLPPRNESYWWFDILYRLHNGGIVHIDAATLAQRVRSETTNAFAILQRTGKSSYVNL